MPENQSEASIYSSLRHLLPIVALSNQGSNSNVSIPALRAEFTKWELEFQRLAPAAFLVVIVATRLGPGLEIELAWLKNHRAGGPLWLVASPDALQHIRCHYRELLESELTWTTLLGDGSLAARLQRVSLPDALKIYLEKALTGTSITKR
jgi:hypothetical protein